MKKFRAIWREFNIKIDVVEIDKEIENYVFIDKRRYKKRSETQAFFDTWKEAHQWLIRKAEDAVVYADATARGACMTQSKVVGMKEPLNA